MKNFEIYTITESLKKLTQTDKDIPVIVGYKILKNLKTLSSITESFEETKDKIVKKYGTPSEDGRTVTIQKDNENYEKVVKELNELALLEVELPKLEKIKLKDIEKLELPLESISALDFMIEESEE